MDDRKISTEEYEEAGYALISIIKAALHQGKIELNKSERLWHIIYCLSEYNHVEGITYLGAKNVSNIPRNVLNKWKKKYDTTVYNQVLFETERKAICQEMEKNKLSYLPIKGTKLVNYYPLPGMRFMADNDIVYGFVGMENGHYCRLGKNEKEKEKYIKLAQKILVNIMMKRGYECQITHGNADIFKKEPVFNFEMHRHLFVSGERFHDYYKDPWFKAKRCINDKYEYYYLDEDEYIYMIAHTFKHFDISGCGIRCLIDLYVFLDKKKNVFDWKYINQKMKSMGLDIFHNKLKKLSFSCFGELSLDEDDKNLLIYMLKSGTYGNIDNFFERMYDKEEGSSSKVKKLKYLKKRLFLSKEEYENSFPIVYQHSYLIPFFTLYRISSAIILRPKKFFKELQFIIRKK